MSKSLGYNNNSVTFHFQSEKQTNMRIQLLNVYNTTVEINVYSKSS